MSELFSTFCATNQLPPDILAGKTPAWEDQVDAYTLSGSGAVQGLQVERYGEFGNNVIQLLHAVYAARRLGLKWVRASSLAGIFQPGVYELDDGLRLMIGQPVLPIDGSALSGRFFFWWGTAGLLRGMSPADAVSIIRKDLRQTVRLPVTPAPTAASTIHIHIRGGSDIFGAKGKLLGAAGKLNAGYVQPPLSYYLKVVRSWFSRYPDGHVVIVSMDRSNPCVGPLEEHLRDAGHSFSWQSGTVEEDVASLYSGEAIVAGWGTFIPMIALLSESVKTVYFFRDAQQGPRLQAGGVSVHTVIDTCGQYLARGDWGNTSEELAAMLNYSVDCLDLQESPGRDT